MFYQEHAYSIEFSSKSKNLDKIVDILERHGAILPITIEGDIITEIKFAVKSEYALAKIEKLFKLHTIY